MTIGVYDGVHRGHQRVIADLRAAASERGLFTTVVTFRRHPAAVLAPDRVPPQLTTLQRRLELFASFGVEQVALLEFDEEFRSRSAESFVTDILVGALDTRFVAVGREFRFGYRQSGDVSLLEKLGAELGFAVVPVALLGDSAPISATRIREVLSRGDVAGAAQLLGRPFEVCGTVVRGDGRGRAIGVPTANLALPPQQALPASGVYAVTVGRGEDRFPAVVNVGVRPTFGGSATVVEAHLLDADVELYGTELCVEFVSRIREERRFDGIDELVDQIHRDIAAARTML